MSFMPEPAVKTDHHIFVHRHLQRRFDRHRKRIDNHKQKGPAFAAAVLALEQQLFGEEVLPSSEKAPVATSSMTPNAPK